MKYVARRAWVFAIACGLFLLAPTSLSGQSALAAGPLLLSSTPPTLPSLLPGEIAFLDEVAQKTWQYISSDYATSTDHYLPWSWRAPSSSNPDLLVNGSYANPTEIGLFLLSYIAAYEMGQSWSPSWTTVKTILSAALDRLNTWQMDTKPDSYDNKVFYQTYWINNVPPEVGGSPGDANHVVPSIDNAFLAASLITIRQYALMKHETTLASKALTILNRMDFRLWYDGDQSMFRLGDIDNPQCGSLADYYSNENRLINFVARALGQLTTAEYQASLNALVQLPKTYTPTSQGEITVDKVAWDGSYFTYTAPALFIREMLSPYGANTIEPATQAQIAYALDHNQNYPAWGFSDSFDVDAGGYVQQGAPPVAMSGAPETRRGLVAPYALALALMTTHAAEAVAKLQLLTASFPAVYDVMYGFKDSVMVNSAASDYAHVSDRFSALGQEYIFLSIANAEGHFVISDYFYRDAGVIAADREMFGSLPSPQSAPPRNYYIINTPTLTWNHLTGAVGYEIQLDSNQTFNHPITSPYYEDATTQANQLWLTTRSLPNCKYYWRVRAQDAQGKWGSWSSLDSFTINAP